MQRNVAEAHPSSVASYIHTMALNRFLTIVKQVVGHRIDRIQSTLYRVCGHRIDRIHITQRHDDDIGYAAKTE